MCVCVLFFRVLNHTLFKWRAADMSILNTDVTSVNFIIRIDLCDISLVKYAAKYLMSILA